MAGKVGPILITLKSTHKVSNGCPWRFWPRKDVCMPTISPVRRPAACDPAVSESSNRPAFRREGNSESPDLIGVLVITREPGELKHLSNPRKRNQCRPMDDRPLAGDSVSSGERNRKSLNLALSQERAGGCRAFIMG